MDAVRRSKIQEAMVRFADGERSAIETLLEELWPALLTFAQRALGSEHDAEDVAQEVFVRICSRINEFDRTRDAVSWAYGIAGYEVLTQRRRRQRRRETTDVELHLRADQRLLQDDALIQEELATALGQVASLLSAEDRALLGLDPGSAQQSEARGATQRKRRQRSLDRLRDLWRRLHGGS